MSLYFDPTNEDANLKLLQYTTIDVYHMQQQVLEEILRKNVNTEYLTQFLDGKPDTKLFKNKVPIVGYEDIKPYIGRIANGEPSEIISAETITDMIKSSGTCGGQQKLIPATAEELKRKTFFHSLCLAVLKRHIEGLDEGKQMFFIFSTPDAKTPAGLVIMNATNNYFKSSEYRNQPANKFNILTSSHEILFCAGTEQSMYCQLLCGLMQRDEVVRIGTTFATVLLRTIKFLEQRWKEICSNIRTGKISDWIADPSCRKAVSCILNKEMPDLADVIEQECRGGSWEGIIKKLWPRAKIVEAIITGSMAQYVTMLDFYCGGLPLVSLPYASSEGLFGINLKPLCKPSEVSYTLVPNMAYCEFLPFDHLSSYPREEGKEHQQTYSLKHGTADLSNVKVGQHYELVVTTFTGLYRYKMGDILKVTGFHNNAPQFQFVQRRSVVLSVDVDKTTEEDLFKAIKNAMQIIEPHGFVLIDYTSYVDISSIPGHYVLFWELCMRGNADQPQLDTSKMEQCCAVVEKSLDLMYKISRSRSKLVGPLEIRVVKNRTFEELMDYYISQGSSLSQYKTPKAIMSEKAIQILNSRVLERFFSNSVPQLNP